jgi:hypothetical protein
MDKTVDKNIGMDRIQPSMVYLTLSTLVYRRGSRFENAPPTSQDRAKIDVLLISPAHSEQVRSRQFRLLFSVLPIALFCWELPLLFPVGTNESLCSPNHFRVGFIGFNDLPLQFNKGRTSYEKKNSPKHIP